MNVLVLKFPQKLCLSIVYKASGLGANPAFRCFIFRGQPIDECGHRFHRLDGADALARAPYVLQALAPPVAVSKSIFEGSASGRLSGSMPEATIELFR